MKPFSGAGLAPHSGVKFVQCETMWCLNIMAMLSSRQQAARIYVQGITQEVICKKCWRL